MNHEEDIKLNIARILYPVKTLGPGNRLGIWVYGCQRDCPGCANPELQKTPPDRTVDLSVIRRAIEQIGSGDLPPIDGFTISGGEPFNQPEALEGMIDLFRETSDDILVFTGYRRQELAQYEGSIISRISVLVDGEYIEAENLSHPLKGSDNQNIHYINPDYQEAYEAYIQDMKGKQLTQTFTLIDGRVAAGIHKPDFSEEYKKRIRRKGFRSI